MIKIKIFTANSIEELEQDVNVFLEGTRKFLDASFTEDDYLYKVMVVYDE